MKQYSTYIFDLDGTLLDTLQDLAVSVNYALRQCSMPERTLDEVRQFVGNGVRMLMKRAVPQGEDNPRFQEAFDIFRSHYLEHSLDTTAPYPGIMEMLVRLKASGKRMAVVSNKLQAGVDELAASFFNGVIDVAIGERSGIPRKPAPDMVLAALKELGVEPAEAIYVGDSDVDLQTAANSGLPCISVLWGFRSRDFLVAHGATMFAQQPQDVLSMV